MKLSSRSRYGFRAILELAANFGKGPLQIQTIAKREDISNKYLEQLIAMLKSTGLVRSLRGPKGGYLLAKKPSEIKLSTVFSALEGPVLKAECKTHNRFNKGCNDCIVSHVWSKFNNTVWDLFESMTLQDMVDMAGGKKTN